MSYVIAVYLIVGFAVSIYGMALYASFRRLRKAAGSTKGDGNE
jgi:hypothetical protein